ncbi:hypothetical protein ACFE04_030806 [Oxalis oulophora]
MNTPSGGTGLADQSQSQSHEKLSSSPVQSTSTPVRKTRKINTTLLKAILIPFVSSCGVLTNDYKNMKKENKSLKKNIKSQHQVITKLNSLFEELKQSVAHQSITYIDQNNRVEGVENHVMNIYSREMMNILARRGGSRSGSNQNDPNQTSAFIDHLLMMGFDDEVLTRLMMGGTVRKTLAYLFGSANIVESPGQGCYTGPQIRSVQLNLVKTELKKEIPKLNKYLARSKSDMYDET